ncbi:hypothetical protein [uncultured Roseibium sp.]|uniref:helix-turn-helix transcriptional regulator n=1 Tax=uncultured Roseibium sp. TaxID=1936171 RepID=UPI0026019BA1|nr:hypothetical protein [uncultured Roseibium sp.]
MPVLSKTDEVELLLRVLECSTQSEAWPRILEAIDSSLACKCFLAEFDDDGEAPARDFGAVLERIETEGGRTALQFLISEASLFYPYCKTALNRHASVSDDISRVDQAGAMDRVSEVDTVAPLQQAPGLISPVWRGDRTTILFGCFFLEHTPETVDVAIASETFRRLTKAISPALSLHFQLEKERVGNLMQQVLLSSLDRSVILISADRDILATTPTGSTAFADIDAAEPRRGKLVIKNKLIEAALQDLSAECNSSQQTFKSSGIADQTRSVYVTAADNAPRRVAIEMVPPALTESSSTSTPWFLVSVSESADLPEELEQVLQDRYDLSQSEAHLARNLTMTGSMNETVAQLGITRNTAKTHLRRIYEKTGAHTQLQLASLIYRLAGLF